MEVIINPNDIEYLNSEKLDSEIRFFNNYMKSSYASRSYIRKDEIPTIYYFLKNSNIMRKLFYNSGWYLSFDSTHDIKAKPVNKMNWFEKLYYKWFIL